MALFKPLVGTAMSGAIGGLVFSHNKGGPYIRNLGIPTNPNTIFQQVVRAAVSSLTASWASLTPTQRDGWETYAANVQITNRIGQQVNISGMAMYVRGNVTKIQIGTPRQDNAPSIFNLGPKSATPVSNATQAIQTIDIAFSSGGITDPWASEVGSFLVVYVGRPQNASVRFFKGPYRLTGFLQGDPVPPVPPFVVGTPFPFLAGQRIFTRTIVSYFDGRYTSTFRSDTVAVA